MHRLKALLGFSALLGTAFPARAIPRVPPVASYRIEAAWDGEQKTLVGRETVTFVNRTSRELPDVVLHLYLNGFRNTRSTLWRGLPPPSGSAAFGFCELKRVALPDGTDLTRRISFETPAGDNPDDRTLARVPLPRPVRPGETLVLEVDFESRLPRGVLRTGWKDDFVFAGQWFPKLAKATDAGWRGRPFHSSTEFFADFGSYDVTLLLPAEVKGKVAVTGRVVEEADDAAERVRVRAHAEDVHDFAFSFSPRFEVRKETVAPKGLPRVDVLLFLQPDHRRSRERYLRAAREGLALFGTWLTPYPYPVLTIVDPPTGSGAEAMEYPTLFTGATAWLSPAAGGEPGAVTLHELAHQWFQGMLASDETSEAHLDEGLVSWISARATTRIFGTPSPVVEAFGVPIPMRSLKRPLPEGESQDALDQAAFSRSDPVLRETWRSLDDAAVRTNAYSRTALLLESVARTSGEQPLFAAIREYARRFAFRHPTTGDFLGVLGEVAGPEARDLVERGWTSAGAADYAVTRASTRRAAPGAGYLGEGPRRAYRAPAAPARSFESTVVVQRLGEIAWPVEVEMRFEGGQTVTRRWDGRAEWMRWRITGPRLVSAVVDPRRTCLLDVNRLNDGLRTEPDPTVARAWGHRLRFLAQNLLELFALVAVLPGASW
ncbi:MAG: M1 family metallopeptidase [Holophagales bacterium]|nr:M1 family metallopeptidase [Holophagales bacterium]